MKKLHENKLFGFQVNYIYIAYDLVKCKDLTILEVWWIETKE